MTTLDDLKAAVEGRGVQRVYKAGAVRTPDGSKPQYPYAVVSATIPDKVSRTMNGTAADLNRGAVQFFGRTVDSVLDLASMADLDGSFINGNLVTREVSSEPFRDPDDNGVIALTLAFQF